MISTGSTLLGAGASAYKPGRFDWWDSLGFTGTNDRGGLSFGSNQDWFLHFMHEANHQCSTLHD